jgi:hypothetical protein
MAIDGARIQLITPEGLFYLDDEGKEQFIDFEECFQREFARFTDPHHLKKFREINPSMTDEQLQEDFEWRKTWKKIANRNFDPIDALPYIEFYTDPPIRFEFATVDAFHRMRFFIEKNTHWRTADLA